jgi:ABC-2 type transport system permease protein
VNTRRIGAVALRQLYLMRGSPARVLPLVAWVAVDIVLWGFITRYLNAITADRFDFVPVLLGAVLLWDFFTRVMQGVTTAFFEDVWSRNFLNLFATPISVGEYITGLVCTSIITSMAGLAVMVALAGAVFGLSFLGYGMAMLPFVGILFLFGIAFGIFSCAVVLRFGPASEWLIWPIPAMLSPFVGVFYPIATLPAWMQGVAHLLPASYVFEGLRAIAGGRDFPAVSLVWGGGLAIAYILAAFALFLGIYRHAMRTGLIARYSAESVA